MKARELSVNAVFAGRIYRGLASLAAEDRSGGGGEPLRRRDADAAIVRDAPAIADVASTNLPSAPPAGPAGSTSRRNRSSTDSRRRRAPGAGPTRRSWLLRISTAGWTALLAGCVGRQSALDPAGRMAEAIARDWWLNFAITGIVYLIVMAVAAWAVVRFRDREPRPGEVVRPDRTRERRGEVILMSGLAASVVLLGVLGAADLGTRRAITPAPRPHVVQVTAHQWWWDFHYRAAEPVNDVDSPNELHLPVGEDVRLQLVSADVIHSLWIPNVTGKRDLIPGHPTELFIRATRPGTFMGECAEFCGHQHATMRFVVVAEPPDSFQTWLAAQRVTPSEPVAALEKHGEAVFLGSTCVSCHAIRGTLANGQVGPDLTHVGSRARIASGTWVNDRGHLVAWIHDPQQVRPGVFMPPNPLPPDDLDALSAYLASLR